MKIYAAAAVFFFISSSAFAQDADALRVLKDIETKMSEIQTLSTRFTQKKQLSLFQKEILLTGSIAMEKPGRFSWRTESPLKYSIVVHDGKVSQWDEDTDRVETVSFSSSPAARLIVEQMQVWFYGQYASIAGQYDISLISKEPPVIKFTVTEKSPAHGLIKAVTVRFHQDLKHIDSIQTEEMNGDQSSMDFTGTVLNAPVSPEMWKAKHAG